MPILNWLNDDQARKISANIPYRLLEADPNFSFMAADTENMLIQGDNLEALKALLPYYAGQVKCIYIDPPYNTQSAFEHYDDNLEHATWLSMIYPRLELLRDLLAIDGSIWVSIDDNEGHYLKVLLDEIFGRNNFVTSFIWQKVDSPNDNKVPITPDHEYILCYAKNISLAKFRKKSDASVLNAYPNIADDGRRYRDRLLKKNGKNSLREDRPTMFFPVPGPDGKDVYPIHDDGREANWAFGKPRVFEMLSSEKIVWKERSLNGEKKWVPYTREYAPDIPERPNPTILLDVKTSRQAKAHQRQLLENTEPFATVKPEHLVARILEICTNSGDLVLDAFLGSGTTTAVAHKLGRQYIGIESGEQLITHCFPRMKEVISGEQGGISEDYNWDGGGGFRFYHLSEAVFDEQGQINPEVRFRELAAHVWFIETRTPLQDVIARAQPEAIPTSGEEIASRQRAPLAMTPLLGIHNETAYYLLYNGILGDKRPEAGNVLTSRVLETLPSFDPAQDKPHTGPKVIYGEYSTLDEDTLREQNITFKHIPYDIKAR